MIIPDKYKNLANAVRNEVYGRDVRESIAKSIEETGASSEAAIEITQQLIDGSFDEGILNTEIERKLNELEQEYAPKLTNLSEQLAEIAKMTEKIIINVSDYGIIGDGLTDVTDNLQELLNNGGNFYFPEGIYMIDPLKSLNLTNNTTIKLHDSAVLKAIPNDSTHYSVININDKKNISIEGGTIAGERYEHLGETGEWGHGIRINRSEDISIVNITVKDCWGDGIYVGGSNNGMPPCKNISLSKVICDGNRRQGMSVTNVKFLYVNECEFNNTSGTSPEAGIDIEPNEFGLVTDVYISDTSFSNNFRGLHMYGVLDDTLIENINLINLTFKDENYSIDGSSCLNIEGENINNVYGINLKMYNSNRGVRIFRGATNIVLENVLAMNNARNVEIRRCSDIKISGNFINEGSLPNYNIYIEDVDNLSIVDSKVEGAVESAIIFINMNHSKISGVFISEIDKYPLRGSRSSFNNISEITIIPNFYQDDGLSYVYLYNDSLNNSLTKFFVATGDLNYRAGYGFQFERGAVGNYVAFNNIAPETISKFFVSGELGNVVEFNRVTEQ